MLDHLASRAKAYAALIGAVLTAIIGTGTDNKWLTLGAAVLTAVATYQVPNSDEAFDAAPKDESGAVEPGSAALGLVLGLLIAYLLLR